MHNNLVTINLYCINVMPLSSTPHVKANPQLVLQLFSALSTFYPIGEKLQNEIVQRMQSIVLEKENYLMRQGEHCYHFYFVIKGILVGTTNRNNKQLTSFIVTDGNFVTSVTGMYGLIPSEDAVYAVEESLLFALHVDDMNELYNQFPEMNILMRKIFENYFQGAHERSNMTRLSTAKEKYLYLRSYIPEHIHRIPLAHTASYLDMRPETLLRVKRELETEQDQKQWPRLLSDLEAYVQKHQSFRQKELTISKLAKDSNIPQTQLNFLLKNFYNKSFIKYVNSLRVEYVKEKLTHSKEWKHFTIEGIGMDAGFKSRSVFFSEFKKQTGFTPGEYIKRAETSPEFEFQTSGTVIDSLQ